MEKISQVTVQIPKTIVQTPGETSNLRGAWLDAVKSAFERVPEAPKLPANVIPDRLLNLIDYQKRISRWNMQVELVSRCADSLGSSVRRLQQGANG